MECSLNAFFRCSSGSNGPRKPLHDECDRVAVTLHVVGCGAGANFDRHLGCRHQGSRTPREEYALCATRRRSQTLTTREEESFIRLLNPRRGKWTAQEVLFTHRIACITSPSPHQAQSQYRHPAWSERHSPRSAIDFRRPFRATALLAYANR